MAFIFKSASCVVAGTFNTYVFQPQWLIANSLLPKEAELLVETNMAQPGLRLSATDWPFRWTISPMGITIETNDPKADCGKVMAQVIGILRHTPLQAIGNNVTLEAPESEPSVQSLLQCLTTMKPPTGTHLKHRTVAVGVVRGDTQFNVQISRSDDGITLLANAHTPLSEPNADKVIGLANDFFEHRSFAASISKELFGASIAL